MAQDPKEVQDMSKRIWRRLRLRKAPEASRYPTHCWSAGSLGTTQEPMTWFRCKSCGGTMLDSPHALPDRRHPFCPNPPFMGWEVADPAEAFTATLGATRGMSQSSFERVMKGPR